jgi:DNA-binding NarL/FixJ family response regulator
MVRGTARRHTAGMKVFLVEDSPLVLERLTEMLGAIQGVSIVGHAAGVREAIAAILDAKPDVVVLDLKLAQGSGFDVLSAVHKREPGIDFYMLSNFASEPYRRHAERLGALGFFDKSSEFEHVRDVVAQRAAGKSI